MKGDKDIKFAQHFTELSISEQTKRAIKEMGFQKMTDIQRESIPHALAGRDILGAAPTGSGKTLSFLIPIVEQLHRKQWTSENGLAAIVITPTRELAIQIEKHLSNLAKHHELQVGIVMGGVNIKTEKELLPRLNILIATPGRLLQHMDETSDFQYDNLQVLVLDEADRLLEMGFQETLDDIIKNLPKKRQTMLYSATQTKAVEDLARLGLSNPEYVSTYKNDQVTVSSTVEQHITVVPLTEKLNTLWSFIKTHQTSKVIVFAATNAQVRFMEKIFKSLHADMKIMALRGKTHQNKRTEMFLNFAERETGILIATDVAQRGLDFSNVDWVVQFDCPLNASEYIHRTGRTARCGKMGKCLLILTPEEEEYMVPALKKVGISPERLKINPVHKLNIADEIAALLVRDPELKHNAMAAVGCYVKHLIKMEKRVSLEKFPIIDYALSMGLANTPVIEILEKTPNASLQKHGSKIMGLAIASLEKIAEEKSAKKPTKIDKLISQTNKTVLSDQYEQFRVKGEEGGDLLVKKQGQQLHEQMDTELDPNRKMSKRAKEKLKKARLVQPGTGTTTKFDEEGNGHVVQKLQPTEELKPEEFFKRVRADVVEHDKQDKVAMKQRQLQKKENAKMRQVGDVDMADQEMLSVAEKRKGEAPQVQAKKPKLNPIPLRKVPVGNGKKSTK